MNVNVFIEMYMIVIIQTTPINQGIADTYAMFLIDTFIWVMLNGLYFFHHKIVIQMCFKRCC